MSLSIALPKQTVFVKSARAQNPAWRVLPARTLTRCDALPTQLFEPSVEAEGLELLNSRVPLANLAFKPRSGGQNWLIILVASIIVRLNRSGRVEQKLCDLAIDQAINFCEDLDDPHRKLSFFGSPFDDASARKLQTDETNPLLDILAAQRNDETNPFSAKIAQRANRRNEPILGRERGNGNRQNEPTLADNRRI